jgi:aspartokinase
MRLKGRGIKPKQIKIIKSYNEPLIIVVSAFYGVTDKLNN